MSNVLRILAVFTKIGSVQERLEERVHRGRFPEAIGDL
jgi:hypothetical protein